MFLLDGVGKEGRPKPVYILFHWLASSLKRIVEIYEDQNLLI